MAELEKKMTACQVLPVARYLGYLMGTSFSYGSKYEYMYEYTYIERVRTRTSQYADM